MQDDWSLTQKRATQYLQLEIDYRRFVRLVYAAFQDLLPIIPVSANVVVWLPVGARDAKVPKRRTACRMHRQCYRAPSIGAFAHGHGD